MIRGGGKIDVGCCYIRPRSYSNRLLLIYSLLLFILRCPLSPAHTERVKVLRATRISPELFEHNWNVCRAIDARTLISQHQKTTRQNKTWSLVIGPVLYLLRAKYENQSRYFIFLILTRQLYYINLKYDPEKISIFKKIWLYKNIALIFMSIIRNRIVWYKTDYGMVLWSYSLVDCI